MASSRSAVSRLTPARSVSRARSASCATALDALRRIVRALGISARTAERSAGVTGAQLLVLEKLHDASAYSLNDLAERTFTHQSTVSVVVDRLVSRGMVARTRAESDGRRIVLTLTAGGRSALRRAPPPAQARLIEALNALPPAECRALARSLEAVVDAMGLEHAPPGMFYEEAVVSLSARRRGAGSSKAQRRAVTAAKRVGRGRSR